MSVELYIRSAGSTRHWVDITCTAPLPSSPPLYHLSTPYPLSVTPLHHHLFSPQLDIQARYRKDTIYQWVCLAWKGVIGIFTWPLARRRLGFASVFVWQDVSNGIWGSRGCRGDNQNSICMHWSFLGQPWFTLGNIPGLWQVQKKKQVCKKCIPISWQLKLELGTETITPTYLH